MVIAQTPLNSTPAPSPFFAESHSPILTNDKAEISPIRNTVRQQQYSATSGKVQGILCIPFVSGDSYT